MARSHGRLDYKYCTNIYILCDDYPILANQEPIQLQGRPTCMSLALNAFMVMPTK